MRRGVAALAAIAMAVLAPSAYGVQETFNHTGQLGQIWTAPDGVNEATFDVYGGQGGHSIFVESAGGLGGRATATLPVSPGRRYRIFVGGQGGFGEPAIDFTAYGGYGSEVKSGTGIEDRMIAAGGGGASVAGDGIPGGFPGSKLDSIDGGSAHPFNLPVHGQGGASWGPPGTEYEQGVRTGNGLVTITYEIDSSPPETSFESGPDGLTNDRTPTFTFSASEAESTFACFDEFVFGGCSGPGASHTTKQLADGPHTVAVTAVDPLGNTDPTPATQTFTVDATAPEVAITEAPSSKVRTTGKKVGVEVSFGSEAGAKFRCRLDRSEFERCDSPYRAKARARSGNGRKHSISVRAKDAAGNAGKLAEIEFRVIRR